MTFEEVQEKLAARSAALARILQTEDGRVLLTALTEIFVDGDLLGQNDRETYFRLGGREVVKYLHRLSQYNERTGKKHG